MYYKLSKFPPKLKVCMIEKWTLKFSILFQRKCNHRGLSCSVRCLFCSKHLQSRVQLVSWVHPPGDTYQTATKVSFLVVHEPVCHCQEHNSISTHWQLSQRNSKQRKCFLQQEELYSFQNLKLNHYSQDPYFFSNLFINPQLC